VRLLFDAQPLAFRRLAQWDGDLVKDLAQARYGHGKTVDAAAHD
jgi:hypothetical protein